MWSLLLAAALTGANAEVELKTLADDTIVGRLLELDSSQASVETSEGPRRIRNTELLTVTFIRAARSAAAKPSVRVELADGSSIAASSYRSDGKSATIALPNLKTVKLPADAVRSVRFVDLPQDDQRDRQWNEISQRTPTADVLVLRKQDALDSVEGVAGRVDDKQVELALEGEDAVPVKRARIEGLIYYRPQATSLPARAGEVLMDGSRIAASQLQLAEDKLQIKTPLGLELEIPLERVDSLDFALGKIRYLSDLEPERAEYEPFFGPLPKASSVKTFFKPRRNAAVGHGPLVVGGKTYTNGLGLRSRTKLAYRLPDKFRQFKAIVAMDDSAADGNLRLSIRGDDRPLWAATVRSGEAAVPLSLDIAGVRRLEIVADFGEQMDIGDRLDLCEARLVK